MEFPQYYLKILHSAEDEDSDEKVVPAKKPMKLEKVGKRIKRIVSEDSSEDDNRKHESRPKVPPPPPIPPLKKAIVENKPVIKKPPPPISSAMDKLPRIPKIQRASETVPADTSVMPQPGPSLCDGNKNPQKN